uniref:Uncharacterized protein n=2 Tax=Avena sativa TaxID=4498 RepID=A0ACD5VYV0_AVESA
MDPSALDQSPIISPDPPHPAIYAEAVQVRHPIESMDYAWLMFERFVFRRDDDGASFPDVRAAPIRAKSITSMGDPFTVAVIPEEPPAVSRLYVKWPGGAGSATELVTTDKGLLLLRLTTDIKLSEGETDKYPYRQDYFICQSAIGSRLPWLSIKRLPECTKPIVLRVGDEDIAIDRRFHADAIGLCRLGNDEFAVVQLAKFFALAEDKMGAELCVLHSAVWTKDDVSDIVAKGKWEVLSLPIRHLQEEFNDIRCWSVDAAITFGDSIVWVDYHQGGMLSYTPRDANFISYN